MTRFATLLAVLALTACPLQKSGGTTTIGPGTGNSGGGDNSSGGGDGMVMVPDLTGKTEAEAVAIVQAAGFKSAAEQYPLSCEGGSSTQIDRIDCQDPAPGTSVKPYTMVKFNLKRSDRISNTVLRRDFDQMPGMTVEQATKLAKSVGHDGPVRVEKLGEFMAGCKANTVCRGSDERGGQSGMSIHDPLILWVNPTLTIAPPPD
jgi:hypothetical protein